MRDAMEIPDRMGMQDVLGMQGSQSSQGSPWRVVGWGRGLGWWKDSCPKSPSRAEGLVGTLATRGLSSFHVGTRGEQQWVHWGFGGQTCNSGETRGQHRP